MNIHKHIMHKRPTKQAGISLVELMVAMVLGLIMTAAVMQTYLSTKQTYNITNGVSRLQENARFGHYFITKDLREAGNRGCITNIRNMLNVHPPTDYLPFEKPVSGWEFTGTSRDDTYTIPSTITTPNSGWTGDGALPAFLRGDVIAGNDVVSFKSFERVDVTVSNSNSISSNNISTNSAHGIDAGSIVMVGDCLQTDLFQHRSASTTNLNSSSGSGTPGNDSGFGASIWDKIHDAKSDVFKLVTTYYSIQEGTSGLPSLFRLRTSEGNLATVDASTKEELVEGVESLQVYYGIDSDADNVPNNYVSADLVSAADWENVVSIRVGLLFQSATNTADVDQATNYTLLDNITLTHAAADNTLRYAVNSTVKLRNRGLPVTISDTLLCNAPEDC